MKPPKQPDISELFSTILKNIPKPGATDKPGWWQTYSYPEIPYVYVDQLIQFTRLALFFQTLMYGGCVHDYSHTGAFIGTIPEVIESFEKIGLKLTYHSYPQDRKKETELFFNMDSGALFVYHQNVKPPKFGYSIVSTSKEQIEKIKELFVNFTAPTEKSNNVYIINSDDHDFDLLNLGSLSTSLNQENYAPDVLKDFDYVVKQFDGDKPLGRLLILNGLPGTGKTFFIRGLLDKMKNGTFILLPPDMVSDLSKPQLIKTISDAAKNKFAAGPLYLIIEDADEALLRRGSDNMSIISTVLNMADGLLGTVLDMRILATTNANKLDIEPAIMRPGRLCKLINLGKLSTNQANELFMKLTNGKTSLDHPFGLGGKILPFTQPATLAEIYQMAAVVK